MPTHDGHSAHISCDIQRMTFRDVVGAKAQRLGDLIQSHPAEGYDLPMSHSFPHLCSRKAVILTATDQLWGTGLTKEHVVFT